MNERLKELYRQAHGTRHYDGDPALDGNPPTVYWQGEASAQRFANLIVRECIDKIEFQFGGGNLMDDGNTHNPEWDNALECVLAMIKQHFGVE